VVAQVGTCRTEILSYYSSPSSQASKRSRFMSRMADREPISLVDSEENCIVETSVEAANIAAPAKKTNFRWSDKFQVERLP